MRGVISIPYIPLKHALYSDKVDKRGYIYGDEKRGDGMTYAEYDLLMAWYGHSEYTIPEIFRIVFRDRT